MAENMLLEKVIALYENNQFDEAEQTLRSLLQNDAKNPDLYYLLGLIASAKNIHSSAVEAFYFALEINPKHLPALFNLAYSLVSWGKLYEAEKTYKKVIKLDKTVKEAYNNLANIYLVLDKKNKAKQMYKKAIEQAPDYAEAKVNLAYLENDFTEIENLAKQYPDEPLSFYYLAKNLYNNNQLEKAYNFLTKALELSVTVDDFFVLLGHIHKKQLQNSLAMEAYQNAININEKNMEAILSLADLLTQANDCVSAEKLYKKALIICPESEDAHLNYAIMLQKDGKTSLALEEYRKVILINDKNAMAHNNLALILHEVGEKEEALGLLFKAFMLDKKIAKISENLKDFILEYAEINAKNAYKITKNWQKLDPANLVAKQTLDKIKL